MKHLCMTIPTVLLAVKYVLYSSLNLLNLKGSLLAQGTSLALGW